MTKPLFYLLALTLTGLLSACGSGVVGEKNDYSEELESYVQKVEAIYLEYGHSIVGLRSIGVELQPLAEDEKGKCEENFIKGNVVVLNEKHWKSSTEAARLVLILHEFGHCYLDRDHAFALVTQGSQSYPSSIMYPAGISDGQFQQYRDQYLREYFEL